LPLDKISRTTWSSHPQSQSVSVRAELVEQEPLRPGDGVPRTDPEALDPAFIGAEGQERRVDERIA
jgi:hypothetical protein